MNQRTHSWIAIRAIALLADENEERNLVKLLAPHAREASVGAWIPDQADAKRGGAGSMVDNHILKIEPYHGEHQERFITRKEELPENVGNHRAVTQFLSEDHSLGNEWWDAAYRGDVDKPGQHLPNRAMALSTMMKDLLLMGNPTIDQLIPGRVRFAEQIHADARTQEEAAATYFFMLSHFIADACMPCHCDGRKLAGYNEGLHKKLELYWSRKVGPAFEKRQLLNRDNTRTPSRVRADSRQVLEQAREVDASFGLEFGEPVIPDLQPKHDVWVEIMQLCRASFALASIIAPPASYPYDSPSARAPFEEVFDGPRRELLTDVDRIVMHDAVLNTAIVWKHVWNKVSKH